MTCREFFEHLDMHITAAYSEGMVPVSNVYCINAIDLDQEALQATKAKVPKQM